jgi:hypothetical protein
MKLLTLGSTHYLIKIMRVPLASQVAVTVILGAFTLAPPVSAEPLLEGSGNAVVELGSVSKSVIINFTFAGSGPVVLTPIFTKDKRPTPWLDGSAPLAGTVFSEKNLSPLIGAKITAPDQWTLEVLPLTSAAKTTSGIVPAVIQLPKATKSDSSRTFTYQGNTDVVVFPISAKGMSGFPVVNSSGSIKKKITLPRGTKYISIWAIGPWKLKK